MSKTKEISDSIDLSKIGNMEAIKVTDPTMKKVFAQSETNFFPTETTKVQLPSRGKPYKNVTEDEDILNGKIVLREMKGSDEKVLGTARFIKDGSVFRRILDNTIISDIESEDLVSTDANYLLFALRAFTYGDEYEFRHRCNSSICEKEFQVKCKISEIQWKELPDDFVEPIVIPLPRSKYTAHVILPRQYHTELIKQDEMKEERRGEFDTDKQSIKRWIYTTIKITDTDGNEVPEGKNKTNWEKFYTDLPASDLAELRAKTKFNTDIESKEVICPYCSSTQKVSIPMGTDFFRP